MTPPMPWNKEHYDCMFSHKNVDECCKDFQNKYPKIKLSSIFTHWNHKNQYRKEYEKLLRESTKHSVLPTTTLTLPDLSLDERAEKLRVTLLTMGLKDGQDIPWKQLVAASKNLFSTEGTVRAVMFGYGTYKERKTSRYFKDIISTSIEGKKIFRKPIIPPTPTTLMVPAKIIHKYDNEKKPAPSFIDDSLLVKDHNLRAEQTQLLKEIVSAIQRQTDICKDTITAINLNTEVGVKTLNFFAEIQKNTKKEKPQPTPQQVTA
jgi:hypothetical protein